MNKITANLSGQTIFTNDSKAHSLYKKSNFGEPVDDKIQYSFSEAIFLHEDNKIEIYSKNKKLSKEDLLKILQKYDKKIRIKYAVFKNLRKKGHIVKTALKFGADFRVYEKGSKPGQKHAKWIIFVDHETSKLTWHEFSAKNRIAHSTKKRLLIAIVDEESSVTYYEVDWIKI